MPVTFALTTKDYESLERAVGARIDKQHGRFNLVWLTQVFGWMFVTLAVFSFFKEYQRNPGIATGFGAILLFAVLAFLLGSLRPWLAQRLYRRYVAASDPSFTAPQSVDIDDGVLVLDSASGRSAVPRTAIIDHSADDRNHYLFITGVQAIIVPKAAASELGAGFAAYLAAVPGEA